MKRTLSTVLFSLAVLSATACMVGEPEDGGDDTLLIEGPTQASLRVVQHNIEKRPDALQNAIAEAKATNAIGIALQEVCPVDVAKLRAQYGSKWTIAEGKGKRPALSGCDLPGGLHDYPSNLAIWTGGTGGKATDYAALGSPANAPGHMVCVQFDKAKVPVHLCSAHLISADWVDPTTGTKYDGETVRERQTTKIKQIARDEWFAGNRNHFGIVAGDFNGKPNTPPLDKLYDTALGGTGDFIDYNRNGAGRAGRETAHSDGSNTTDGQPYDKQIDYIFFSTNRAPIDGPPVKIEADSSDHDLVAATVHMRK
jgi:hypothetical protein